MKNKPEKTDKAKKTPVPVTTEPPRRRKTSAGIVVGIGASAGGLDALERFFRHLPANTGMAFVVVQHLDPAHKGIMPELLQRCTPMKVDLVEDGMKVRPDRVYFIPPNRDMSISHRVLHLVEPSAPHGLRLPIDYFFCSLAEDVRERSIGIILSGMGSDGTEGMRRIMGKTGICLVQEPSTAQFNSMPQSVIDMGCADYIAPVEELADKMVAYSRKAPLLAGSKKVVEASIHNPIGQVLALIRAHMGHDFSFYKHTTLMRRIERRMGIHQIGLISQYADFLKNNIQEIELLFKEFLIGVTNFFRDPDEWTVLIEKAIPLLLGKSAAKNTFRAWVPGCASGEEAYSLAIAFREAVEKAAPLRNCTLQIFATDIDKDAIERARRGFYRPHICANVSGVRLKRFFRKEGDGYRVNQDVRDMVVFAIQNVVMAPPFTKLDILVCRNLLIYLKADVQKKIMRLFHYSLNPGGVLFLGTAENIVGFTGFSQRLNNNVKIFWRGNNSVDGGPGDLTGQLFPIVSVINRPAERNPGALPVLQAIAERVLLRDHTFPAVVVNVHGDILYISGKTGKYLEPASGKVNWNIFVMAREGLRDELAGAIRNAERDRGPVVLDGLRVRTNGGYQAVNCRVRPLSDEEAAEGMFLVIFRDVDDPAGSHEDAPHVKHYRGGVRSAELRKELQRAQEDSRKYREMMQVSLEELKSTNEELQSTNEELQSTNEEYMTSREEMQSLNEELQTVNAEFQVRVNELSRANNDMKNLLDSTEIATLFLDNDLNIIRFTPSTTKIFNLIPRDRGRPLANITSALEYPGIFEDAREVLKTRAFMEKQIKASEGRWYSVRLMPYRTLDDVIEGLVITFLDFTELKRFEARLGELENEKKDVLGKELKYHFILEAFPGAIIAIDLENLAVAECNGAAELLTGYAREELLLIHADDIFPPGVSEGWKLLSASAETGGMMYSEQKIRMKNGTMIAVPAGFRLTDFGDRRHVFVFFKAAG